MGAIRVSVDERLLKFFTANLPLEIFVETGTWLGETLEVAQTYFQACFSVENTGLYHAEVAAKFSGAENVFVEKGHAPDLLASIHDHVSTTPTFFWLDSHHIGDPEEFLETNRPCETTLMAELDAIGEIHPDSVLAIDDARLFISTPPKQYNITPPWPDLESIGERLAQIAHDHVLTVYDDTLVYYPRRVKENFLLFAHQNSLDILGAFLDARAFRDLQAEEKSGGKGILGRFMKRGK